MIPHFCHTIEGFTTESIVRLYADTVARFPGPAVFVEVGCYKGQSAAFLAVEIANSGKNIRLFTVDNAIHFRHGFTEAMKRGGVEHIVSSIWRTSRRAAQQFPNGSLDFVFIDADHEYTAVHADIVAWMPKVRSGGRIAGHDYCSIFPGVDRAVGELVPGAKLFGQDCWVYDT